MKNHKNSGGKTMLLTKSAARRLSLLSGSSLAAAGLTVFVSASAALAPTVATAQATCVSGTAVSNNGSNSVVIAGGTNNPGIVCSYVGTGATVSTSGPLTVSSTAGGTGINLTATGSSSITWDSTLGTAADDARISGSNFTNGPVIDAISGTGDITILLDGVNGAGTTSTGSTHAVRAISSGGDIVITGQNITASATSQFGFAGVEARSVANGNVSVTTSENVFGRLYGIIASVADGDLTIAGTGAANRTFQAGSGLSLDPGPIAGIHATTGAGLLTVTAHGTSHPGTGVFLDAGGDVVFIGSGVGSLYSIHLLNAAGSTSTLNITGGTGVIRAEGDGAVNVNVTGLFGAILSNGTTYGAHFDFTDLTTDPTVNFLEGSEWGTGATPNVVDSVAGVTINFAGLFRGKTVQLQELADADAWESLNIINFTGNEDVLNNSGLIWFGGRERGFNPTSTGGGYLFAYGWDPTRHESELRFDGLEEFRHSGKVMFGGYAGQETDFGTDGWYDDILSMPGTHWVGEGGELAMDVSFVAPAAADCVRDPVSGDLGGADCLILMGGSTEGVTYVTVNDVFPNDLGAFSSEGWLLVDVTGGESAQGHFVVGPNTIGYNPINGGMMDKGAFAYAVAYDAAAQQHRLVSLPGPSALQFPLLAGAAHELWRLSTGSWFDRQIDMRGEAAPGVGGGFWMRLAGESADREVMQTAEAAGQTFDFDNSYTQDSYAVTGGLDLLSSSSGDSAYVVGLMAGYASSQLDYAASVNEPEFNSWNGGAYASFMSGGLFVDAAVNANRATMREDVPAFGLVPAGALVSTHLLTVGARADAGWRFPLSGGLFAEPLASVAWSRSKWDDINIAAGDSQRPGVDIEFDDPASLRAGLGGRLGLDQAYGPVRARLSVLGRYWNEVEGGSSALVRNVGEDLVVADDFGGSFTELGVSANVLGLSDALSAFVNFGGRFGDDYEAKTGAVGVRVNW